MNSRDRIQEYHRWVTYQRQEQLVREHRGATDKLVNAGVTAKSVTQGYHSMADKGASEGACYRTLFMREYVDNELLPCEGWLFIRRVLEDGESTRVRASLLETFNLIDGQIRVGDRAADSITLEIFDQVKVGNHISTSSRVDRVDASGDTRFITFLDAVRGDLRSYMK
ncbi:hypothetical protein [Aidingimonas halophila]|uniref:Uncharacterized protein n=1 Tax=Aidingimonas halophila TaxID=574349 RepID=A0A1H3GC11_9GAMM|nr:hypothetical protein [Aidingimonas halophila]GHC32907.1 hypothetical protein GCM10008094_27080 [Aidingimonas halophila]SDY00585.1 hypothetical protein SAMN05443545_10963 [Aidingimonas halophila]